MAASTAVVLVLGGTAPSGCGDNEPAAPPLLPSDAGQPSDSGMPPDGGVKPASVGSAFWDVRRPPPAGAKAGDILRTQERRDAPAGARGWNVVYVAEITEGVMTYVSGEIYVPNAAADKPRDVVLWNHETTGVADACAPSRRDFMEDGHERVPGITELLAKGYVVAMSDYPGQGLPGPAFYMAGRVNARASLDLLKSLQNFAVANASKRFVMYGWSQGGQTTMWAESIATTYAPGFTGLGAGLIAPAVRIRELTLRSMQDKMLAGYVISTLPGIKAAYPALKYSDFLTTEGLEQFPAMADGCFDVWGAAATVQDPYLPNALAPESTWWNAMTEVDNFKPAGTMPFIVLQGSEDTTTPVDFTNREVTALCQSGVGVEYIEVPGLDHVGIVGVAAGKFPAWADDRFAGRPAASTCTPND
jgi:alpha-beta hydrolase superfamily lysophospholipase